MRKKTFTYYLQIFLLTPLWLLSTSPTRKTWFDFKNGLIKHECVFDYDNPVYDKYKYYPCKHRGCGIITTILEET